MTTRYEYYDSGDDSAAGFYSANWKAQTFTTTDSFTIISVKLLVYRIGSPGTVTISIQAVDGNNKPDGSDIAGLSITDDPSDYTIDTDGLWVEYTFATPAILSATTRYAIVMRTASGDLDNRVMPRADISSPTYTNGESLTSSNSGSSWTAVASVDILFETWGNPLVPEKPTNPTPTHTGTDIDFSNLTLSWVNGGGADTYNVYVGDASDNLTLLSSAQSGISIILNDIQRALFTDTCYWRIDAINDGGTTTGDDWSFTVAAPGKAQTPTPTDDQEDIKIRGKDQLKILQWEAP